MQKSSKSDDISVKQIMIQKEIYNNALKEAQAETIKSDDKDSEEVLFDAEDHDKERKSEGGFVKRNFEIVDHLPELNNDESSKNQPETTEKDEIEDLSLSVNNSDLERPDLDDELRPLPSPSPVLENQPPEKLEICKSISQIRNETKKDKPHRHKIEKSVSQNFSKPAYSFLGLGGGGLSKPKKPRAEFPRMAREEFKKVKRIKTVREGDDYYYSLKENQYSIGSKIFDKDVINSIHISNRERKERIYSQKYAKNIEYLEGYLMVTKNLKEFILETEINGVTGEEEEAIILDSFTEISEQVIGKAIYFSIHYI